MRLPSLVLAVLSTCPLVFSSSLANHEDSFPWPWPTHPRTTTIIDLLSTNEEFTPLIKILQRTALIPILNASENVTLIAPIADAIAKFDGDITRELMMYHILNGSVLSSMVEDEVVVESILRMDPKDNRSAGIGVKLQREGDRGRGQGVLRIGDVARVVKSDWEANNGVVQVVDKLIRIPDTIETLVEKSKELSTFEKLFKTLSFPRTYSLFAPDNNAFDTLHPLEVSYLQTRFGQQDRAEFVFRHAADKILYLQDFKTGGNTTSLEGEPLTFSKHNKTVLVDGANITHTNIVARNGALHIISKPLLPASVIFTPLKYLYGMHHDIFAQTVAASDSFWLVNDSSISQTVFAPLDKAYASDFENDSPEVLKQVRYSFVDEEIDLEKLSGQTLLKTKYDLKSLDGAAQRIKVEKKHGKTFINNIEVVSDAVHAGNTTIYSIADKLSPPGILRPTSTQGLSLFRSFHHLVASNLDQRIIFDESAITVFLPVDEAWKSLGLTEKYLLSEAAGDAMKQVLLHNIFKGVYYSDELASHPKTFTSLQGDKVTLHRKGEYIIFDDLKVNTTLEERDILASNGVAHSLSMVPIPKSVCITPENLINATGFTAWRHLIKTQNLTSYLDLEQNYTLLIPTDEAYDLVPISTLRSEPLNSLINLHIIPPSSENPSNLLSRHPVSVSALSGRELHIRQIYPDVWTIQLNDSNTQARILDQGRTSNGAQVLVIDAVLFGPIKERGRWIQVLGVLVFAIAVTGGVAGSVMWIVRLVQRRRDTKPLFHEGDDEEEEPFLNGHS